ncbi:hypothetical protein CORAM0001_1146 [Corynebacterium amycolatum SK46]|nr:hypothetical protein CORAM0001_1146 [Corynebacterium amycolatum SK46]
MTTFPAQPNRVKSDCICVSARLRNRKLGAFYRVSCAASSLPSRSGSSWLPWESSRTGGANGST